MGFQSAYGIFKKKKTPKNHRRPKELKEVDREEEEHNSNLSADNIVWWCGSVDGKWESSINFYILGMFGHWSWFVVIHSDSLVPASLSQPITMWLERWLYPKVGNLANKDNLFPAYCAFKAWVMYGWKGTFVDILIHHQQRLWNDLCPGLEFKW